MKAFPSGAKEGREFQYNRLAGFLRAVSLRLWVLSALEWLLLMMSGVMLVFLGGLFSPVLGEISVYLPFAYHLAAFLFLSFLFLLGLRRLFSRQSMERVAKGVEDQFPGFRDDLTNSLLLFRQLEGGRPPLPVAASLIQAQLRKTADEVSALSPEKVVSFRRAGRYLRILVPLVLALGTVFAFDPHFGRRSLSSVLNPFSTLPVRKAQIVLEPRGALVLRGSPMTISAQVTGTVPDQLSLLLWPEGGEELRRPMKPEGEGRFSYRLTRAQASFRYQATGGHGTSPVYELRVVDPPEVGKLKLTLIPPEYTRLSPEAREGGNIEALKGTMVNLAALATKKVREGIVVLNQETELPLKVEGERLSGSLWVLSPGMYALKIKDEFGFENPNPVQYQIRVIPDQYPSGEIIRPAADLEVTGNETVDLVYAARDDFGISALKLGYRVEDKEYWISLHSPRGKRSLGPETFRWDLSRLALTPGEEVVYRLGVWDNDSVSGPKVAYSPSYTLTIKDEKGRAAREGEEARKIADALLDLLADRLESQGSPAPLSQRPLIQRMDEILKNLETNLERLGDRPERPEWEALERNLSSLRERMAQEPPRGASRESVTQEMERLALLAEELAKKAGMDEVEALARELRSRQRRLIDSLNDLKGTLTPEALAAVEKELKKLEELLRSVMEALSKMATPLPEDFMNSPDLKGLDFQDFFKDLEEIHKRLREGDIAAALEAAQRLLQSLSQMMAALGRAGAQAQRSAFDQLQGEMRRQAGELDKILAEQREILGKTEGIDKEVRKKTQEGEILGPERREEFSGLSSRQDHLRERTEGLQEKLEMLSQLFPAMDTELLNNLREAARSMGEAAGKLTKEDAPGAIPPEQEALRRLTRSEESMQRMAQQMARQMQASRWGYPLGYDPRPGWYYGPWAPMPTLPQPEFTRPPVRGYTGIDKEEFDPPAKDAYRVPQILREKILESLKERVPPQYQREVEKYFKGLTE